MKKLSITCAAILVMASCKNDVRFIREIERLSHQRIEFPEGYIELSCGSSLRLDSLIRKDIKIVSYYGNAVCTACCAKNLLLWQDEIQRIDEDIAYIVVVQSYEGMNFLNFADSLTLNFPIMFYDSDIFEEANKLDDILARNRTFLLNKDNEVILVGEPFGREKLSKLYKRCIDSIRVQ